MSNNKKMKYLEAKHGLLGYAVYNKLLELIYGEKGYFIEWNDDRSLLFCKDNQADLEQPLTLKRFNSILKSCLSDKIYLFDLRLFDEYSILTSEKILEVYMQASYKRVKRTIIKEYLPYTLKLFLTSFPMDNVIVYSLKDINKPLNVNRPDIRVKYSKGKYSIPQNEFDIRYGKIWLERAKEHFPTTGRDLDKYVRAIFELRTLDKLSEDRIKKITEYLSKKVILYGDFSWFTNIQIPWKLRVKSSKTDQKYWAMIEDSMKKKTQLKAW